MISNVPQLSQANEQPKDLMVGVTLYKIMNNITILFESASKPPLEVDWNGGGLEWHALI